MTPVIKSEEIINQIRQLQDELNKMVRSLVTFPTKSKQNRMKKIDDTLSVYWKYLHTLYPEITSEDIADYENLPSRSMDATVGAEVHKSYSSVFNNPDKSPKIQEMKADEETVPLSAYEQVKAERNQAFAQLNALGISFGEDPKFTQKRIEDTVIEKFSAGIADSICEYLDTNPNPDDRDGVIHGLLRGKSLEDLIDIDKDDEREI